MKDNDMPEVIYANSRIIKQEILESKIGGDFKYILADTSISRAEHEELYNIMTTAHRDQINDIHKRHEAQLKELENRSIEVVNYEMRLEGSFIRDRIIDNLTKAFKEVV